LALAPWALWAAWGDWAAWAALAWAVRWVHAQAGPGSAATPSTLAPRTPCLGSAHSTAHNRCVSHREVVSERGRGRTDEAGMRKGSGVAPNRTGGYYCSAMAWWRQGAASACGGGREMDRPPTHADPLMCKGVQSPVSTPWVLRRERGRTLGSWMLLVCLIHASYADLFLNECECTAVRASSKGR
jgi:hypothetical protein